MNAPLNISRCPSNGRSWLIQTLVLAGVGIACWAAAASPSLPATSFSIDWFHIGAGSGVSSNQQFTVAGSIGQHETAGTLSGGSFALTGGFWSVIAAVQTPGAPPLTLSLSQPNAMVLSWPSAAAGFVLQESADLAPGSWSDVTNAVTTVNNASQIGISLSKGYQFYRLIQPVR